eukprot:6491249-Amphidinium_carterae.1
MGVFAFFQTPICNTLDFEFVEYVSISMSRGSLSQLNPRRPGDVDRHPTEPPTVLEVLCKFR